MTTALDPPKTEDSLEEMVDGYVRRGWRVEARTDTSAVVAKGHRTNHLLHLVLSLITLGFWVPVWICIAAFGGEKRRILTV